MRLYFKPGACSLASRITLTELGIAHEAVQVDTERGITATGADYRAINSMGYVPALELDGGAVLTENPAILQYLADLEPSARLAPPYGTLERAYLQQWLNFISSELHKAYSPYFSAESPQGAARDAAMARIERRIGDVESALADGRSFLLGSSFSVADAYLFVVLNWSASIQHDLTSWPHVRAFMKRVGAREAVRAAMHAEGLRVPEAA